MSIESQPLYNQTNILSWKTSYPFHNVKDATEPPIQSYNYFSNILPSDKILRRFSHITSNKYVWKLSISPDGIYLVILKNNNIEIRSSKQDFNQILFQCQIYKDFYPQWRTISWSNSSNYFAVSFTNGMCNVWDLQGSKLSLNTNCVKSNEFDVIIKIMISDVSKGRINVVVFTLNGKLFVYNINNFKVIRHFKSNLKLFSTPVLCCESSGNLAVLGTYNQTNCAHGNDAYKSGIVVCRLIDEEPFLLSNFTNQSSFNVKKSWLSFFAHGKSSDAVFLIRLSKDNRNLAALHYSGKLTFWNFPSLLALCSIWRSTPLCINPELGTELGQLRVYPSRYRETGIVDVCWWHGEYIAVALQNGRVFILGIDQPSDGTTQFDASAENCSSPNEIGSIPFNSNKKREEKTPSEPKHASKASKPNETESIFLDPYPKLEESADKTFFALNCISKSHKTIETDPKINEIVAKKSWSWNIFAKLLGYLLPDTDSSKLAESVQLCSQNYTLISHELTTPEELFVIRIEKKYYAEALVLATKYGLDSDLVFKKQWRDSKKTITDITGILIKIKKRSWILNECLEQIPSDIASMKLLLILGFYLTDIDQLKEGIVDDEELNENTISAIGPEFRNNSVDKSVIDSLNIDTLSLNEVELIRIRMKLLNHCDKLTVYEQILTLTRTNFCDQFFSELKKLSAFEIAIKFARNNNIVGLQVLLQFYRASLAKHLLIILSNIPESVKPSTYRSLLTDNFSIMSNLASSSPIIDLDWCESKKFVNIYNSDSTEDEYYQHNPDHSNFILTSSNSDHQLILSDWCHQRIRSIEYETFNSSNALEMLQIFYDLGQEIDHNLEFNLRFLNEGVYNCQVGNAFISLSDFESLSDLDKATILMSKTSTERFLVNFNQWIMPMLEEINNRSTDRALTFFREYLSNLGKKYLICARKLLEDKESLEKVNEIVPFKEVVGVFITIICEDDDVMNINECANISRILTTMIPTEYIIEGKQLHEVDNYITVLRILEKYEMKKTIRFVHENKMKGELVENMITNMVFHYLRGVKNINKGIIKSVFTEIQIALSLVFKSVHPTLIYRNLLKSLLESGDKKKISLACEFMILTTKISSLDDQNYHEKLIDFPDAVKCILIAVRNYINMSTSSKDTNMTLAKYCLNVVVDPTEETIQEWDLIKCAEFLDKWQCSLVPIELRYADNRFQLLKNCLEKNKNLYHEMEEVVEAGTYFYGDKSATKKFKEGEALRLIAQTACSNNDQPNLEIAMLSLLHRNHTPCWEECVMTLKMGDFPISTKHKLGKYAVTYCPDAMLIDTLRVVNEVDLVAVTQTDCLPPATNTNSNLITRPMKYLSSGLTDLSSKIKLKSLIDKSSDTLLKLTQIGVRGVQESLYKNDNQQLTSMSVDLIYTTKGRFNVAYQEEVNISDIDRLLTLPLIIDINDEKRLNEIDQMHFKMVQFNISRDTHLAIIHAMLINDVSLIYRLGNDLIANVYTKALIYSMVALNLICKYNPPFLSQLNTISTDKIEDLLAPLMNDMSSNELTLLQSTKQEFNDYLLVDTVSASFPTLCPIKFFSSVDYRKQIISQLAEFSENSQLFPYALSLAERYNVRHYEVKWNYFISFVAGSCSPPSIFEQNYPIFNEVFNVKSFLDESFSLIAEDLEKRLASNSISRVSELRVVLKLLPVTYDTLLLFNKTPSLHRTLMGIFDLIFIDTAVECDYLDLCIGNNLEIIVCLKQVVNSDNVESCSQLLHEFGLSDEFAKIKKDFSSVLANQMLWCKTEGNNDDSTILLRFNKSLANFGVNDFENCKEFIFNTLFQQTDTYLSPDLKVNILHDAGKKIDDISNSIPNNDNGDDDNYIVGKWSCVSLEVMIWINHLENTVGKVVEVLRQLSSVTKTIVLTAEYMPPDNYWQCLLTEMLLHGTSYQDLFTFTWDLSLDSFIIDDAIISHIGYISSSKYLPIDGIVEKLGQIVEELDDYMDSDNVESILTHVLEQVTEGKIEIHRMLLQEFVLRFRKNKSQSTLPINKHVMIILQKMGLPVNDKVIFQKNNLHLIDALMQDCEDPEKMKVIPKVIELIELVEEDNNLWQCWIKACVIRGSGFCSVIYEQFENLKNNKLYSCRIDRLLKDAVQALTAFNPAEAISILILIDPISAVDKVQQILLVLKSDPAEYANTMKHINIKALKIIVNDKLIPIYAKTILYQRLVNFITKELTDSNIVQEVLEQLKEKGLTDEATWLTSSSSHLNPAMKTIEMVSGFWKRFSSTSNN